MHTIITIARQFGSGGREVGKALAAKYPIPFYDKELIEMAREKSGLDADILANVDEKATNSLLYALATGGLLLNNRFVLNAERTLNDQLFFLQSDAIRKIALEGPCVVVGRCADYVLREFSYVVHVFIHAPLEDRVKRIAQIQGITAEEAESLILRTDKQRASYYNFYTDRKWGQIADYDLALNTGALGIDGAADLIAEFVRLHEAKK